MAIVSKKIEWKLMYYIKDSKQSSRYHLHYTTSMAEIW